jgi:ubiquinone biosynthesis protein UbiJ
MDQELVQYLDERFAGVDLRFEAIRREFEEMRGEMHEGFDEVKRHNGILIEDLRYKVQLVAEGFATFAEGRYAQDQARVDERFRETHALIRSSYTHLNQRVENLERKGQS